MSANKESDATNTHQDKFAWTEPDDYYIVSQPEESEGEQQTETSEEPQEPKATVIDYNSPLGEKVKQQIEENKKAGKWGVGKSPLDTLH